MVVDVVLAMKPLSDSFVKNAVEYSVAGLNIDGCRLSSEKLTGWGEGPAGGGTWNEDNCGLGKSGDARPIQGRFPTNVIFENGVVTDSFLIMSGAGNMRKTRCSITENQTYIGNPNYYANYGGSAARFFWGFDGD